MLKSLISKKNGQNILTLSDTFIVSTLFQKSDWFEFFSPDYISSRTIICTAIVLENLFKQLMFCTCGRYSEPVCLMFMVFWDMKAIQASPLTQTMQIEYKIVRDCRKFCFLWKFCFRRIFEISKFVAAYGFLTNKKLPDADAV